MTKLLEVMVLPTLYKAVDIARFVKGASLLVLYIATARYYIQLSYITSFVESAYLTMVPLHYIASTLHVPGTSRLPGTQSIHVHIASFVEGAIVNLHQCSTRLRQHVWP